MKRSGSRPMHNLYFGKIPSQQPAVRTNEYFRNRKGTSDAFCREFFRPRDLFTKSMLQEKSLNLIPPQPVQKERSTF